MLPVHSIASSVLASIVRRQPASRARTEFAWSVAVGPALARATSVELHDGVLFVTPRDGRWVREIERARDTILIRLQALLGVPAIHDIRLLDAPLPAHLSRRPPPADY